MPVLELPASPPADAEVGQCWQPAALPIPAAPRAQAQPAVARVAQGIRGPGLYLQAGSLPSLALWKLRPPGHCLRVSCYAGATKDMGKMLGGEEEKDPDAQKKEEERQEALRQQEEERKAKHARMEAEREKVRQQIRDKVGKQLPMLLGGWE